MSPEKNNSNLRNIKDQMPTIEVKPQPPEIMELDEEIVAVGKAKLAGLDFENIYGDEDRSIPEFMFRTQAKKIRELFQTPNELKIAFSSEQKIAQSQKDMLIDGIDLDFVKRYCQKSQIDFVDDADALMIVGFEINSAGDTNV